MGRKKNLVIDDDEYSIGTEVSEESVPKDENRVAPGGKKKKGKKGINSKKEEELDDDEENDKKGRGRGLFSASACDAIGDEDGAVNHDDDEVVLFSGKKKKKGKTSIKSKFDALDEDDKVEDVDVDEEPISFAGKKKKTSKKGGGNAFAAALLDEENDGGDVEADDDDDDDAVFKFSGKKKSSKKKGGSVAFATLGDGDDAEVGDSVASTTTATKVEVAAEASKNKKKKKKGGRSAQEEDDLDKILAELGEAPPAPASAPAPAPISQEDKVNVAEAEVEKDCEEEGGVAESAATKKKKKKKEKEKEKKAAAAAAVKEEKKEDVKNETAKGKLGDKKVPKHVREMQEALARRQEAEERKKKEEEEKLRKEEEERCRLEELERQVEEAKRRKKEKEKQKIQEKKAEGRYFTKKEKEEQRRLVAIRNQFLSKGIPFPTADNAASTKRPIYSTKKSKPQPNGAKPETKQEEVAVVDNAGEPEKDEEVMTPDVEVKVDVDVKQEKPNEEEEEEEEDDDEDWDAKSWDDANLGLPVKNAFEDEEPESVVAKPVVKKEVKKTEQTVANDRTQLSSVAKPAAAPKKETPSQPATKQTGVKKETPSSSEVSLRSPICCIMGHVDTGKTKLLDCIRGTNVQEGEAGGITQQIGATYFPADNIRQRTQELKADAKLNVPGLLVIDTPGHESFTNLRSRGSGLCDIAILVVDIMHGLEQQTIESLNLLRMRNTEFIVALNKVDRLYGWKTCRNAPIRKAIKQQSKDVENEFNMRLVQMITQLKEQGLNTELYYKNKEMGETFNIVPTSAISGEGIPDLLLLLVQWTQKTMVEKLTFSEEIQCTVLEVKVVEGHGTTIDVVLVNGVLREGDQIVVCGMQGPIVTTIRALLTPHPMKELRVKGTYLHHKEIKAAQGIKISAQGLEHAIAGTGLHVVEPDDDLEEIKELAEEDMKSVMSRIDKSGEGVCVQASTLGSLEALLEFLKSPAVTIPVSGISIGPVHKKDVMKAGVMLEKKKEYAAILAFDVKVTPEAREYADEVGVKIFMADIIYHLFDQFKAYIDNIKEEKKRESADEAVFPCVLKILPNCIFNKKDPIVLGVDVCEGIAKVGTPICIPSQDFIDIGRIASIENNHKAVDTAKKGQQVAIKIVGNNPEEQQKMFGRHFDIVDELVSHISRRSIDVLKTNYRDDLSNDEWRLVVRLKNIFQIR